MRQLFSCILCLSILFLSMPGTAMAGEEAKGQFIGNYLNIIDKSFKMQSSSWESMQRNTFTFNFDGELTESSYEGLDGITLSNVPCQGSLEIISNQKEGRAEVNFEGQFMEKTVDGSVYINEEGIIIPKKTMKSLAVLNPTFAEDFKDMPAYLVVKTSEEDWAVLRDSFTESMAIYGMKDEVKAFYQALFDTIPASYFYYEDGYAVLDLKPSLLGSAAFVKNLKHNSRDLAEKFTALMTKPTYLSDEEFTVMKQEMVDSFVASVESLQISELKDIELPFTINEFKVLTKYDSVDIYIHISSDLEVKWDLKISANNLLTSSNSYSSLVDIGLLIEATDYSLDFALHGKDESTTRKSNVDFTLAGSFTEVNESASGKIDMQIKMDFMSQSRINWPELNDENSMVMEASDFMPSEEEWDPYQGDDYEGVKVYIYGHPMYFSEGQPLISDSRTLLPLRDTVVYNLGGEVSWQPPDTVVVSNGYDEDLVLKINSTTCYQGDQTLTVDTAPVIIDGSTYVPVRLIAEYFGYTVEWDESSKSIFID
ncbi:MAG: copper amine oxidase N-terminal domain-containing protein [Syntrophomonadaceae bacterium]